MKRIDLLLALFGAMAGVAVSALRAYKHKDEAETPIFGINIPAGYRDCRLISVAHEEGNLNDIRAILGNDIEGNLNFRSLHCLDADSILRITNRLPKGLRRRETAYCLARISTPSSESKQRCEYSSVLHERTRFTLLSKRAYPVPKQNSWSTQSIRSERRAAFHRC